MSTTVTHCLECNASLTASEAQGLCARCLLKLGLASQFGETSIVNAATRRLIPPPLFPFDFGEYRVTRLLGRGGMGAVYEAEHRESARRVALKVLGQTMDSPEMRKRFLREGRLAAAVNHPNCVYIFGTEEIDGAPIIAMELVAGGTLKDAVKRRGPLPVQEAVGAILHVIAGLEAAQAGGVLHRDVKPANCFVTPDGTVKVGDFGLSVSTLAAGDSELTSSGMMLGTPSFASPEQLRGDELDVRADIYSVGATLYALLTGHAPFEGDNAVHVVAAVLDQPPKPIADFRQDAPSALVQLIGKCLAKKRDDRFPDYAALRDALAPFSSQASEPASLGARAVAGMIDYSLAKGLGLLCALSMVGGAIVRQQRFGNEPVTLAEALPSILAMLFAVAYFAIAEGVWGASPGKLLCGLRVVSLGRNALTMPRAALRGFIFIFAASLPTIAYLLFQSFTVLFTFGLVGPWYVLLLFVTARRRNGFAAIHDRLTGARVITRAKAGFRPKLQAALADSQKPMEGAERIGPFHVVAAIGGTWFAAYDDVLRRDVWIRKCEADAPALLTERRDLGRATRLRWIAGARGASGWDAFDAPTGKPLAELSPQPWAAVRCWLFDLTEEVGAGMQDHTLPTAIGLDRVFITADGHAILLDDPWPGAAAAKQFPCANVTEGQLFLSEIAEAAVDRPRLPLHARDFLRRLHATAFDRASFIAGNLRSLLAKPAEITRRRRFASLILAPTLAMIAVIPSSFLLIRFVSDKHAKWTTRPEMAKLEDAFRNVQGLRMIIGNPTFARALTFRESQTANSDWEKQATQYEKYISGHWESFIRSPQFDADPIFGKWPSQNRDALRSIMQKQPSVSPEELARIDAIVDPKLREMDIFTPQKITLVASASLFIGLPILICVSQFFSLLFFGSTLGQRLFGFAVADMRGEVAGRRLMLSRWCIAWVPVITIALLLVSLEGRFKPQDRGTIAMEFLLWLAYLTAAILPAKRGLHDKLAGTQIIPR